MVRLGAVGLMVRAPLIALTVWLLADPLTPHRFRVWLIAFSICSLLLDAASVYVFARILECRPPTIGALVSGLRIPVGILVVVGGGLWAVSAFFDGRKGALKPSDLEPLVGYGWIVLVVTSMVGIANAAAIAVRDSSLARARQR